MLTRCHRARSYDDGEFEVVMLPDRTVRYERLARRGTRLLLLPRLPRLRDAGRAAAAAVNMVSMRTYTTRWRVTRRHLGRRDAQPQQRWRVVVTWSTEETHRVPSAPVALLRTCPPPTLGGLRATGGRMGAAR